MWNRTTVQLVLVFLVAAGAAGCNAEGPPVDSIAAPPVPARLAEMDADLVEQIERRVSAVREAPDDAERWGLLGLLYEAHEILEPALACYERAAALEPDQPRAWYRLALTQNEVGDLESAIVSLERVNELEASYVPAWWQRGRLFLELGRLDEAESAFLEARGIAPRAPAAQAGLARVALQRGDAAEAVRILEALIAGGESQTYLHHLLGSAYRQLQQWERAEIELMKGREGREVWPDPWGHEAMAHRVEFYGLLDDATGFSDSGQSEAAIPVMEDLLRKKPEDRRTLASLSRAYLRVGRTEDGLQLLNRMLELHPDHFETGMNLAAAYEYLGNLDQAMTHINRSIALNPNYAPTHRRRGSILSRKNLFKVAATEYEQAVQLAPNDHVAWRSLGDCHVQLRQWDAAAASLENALRLEPEDARTLSKLGFARMQLGDHRGAEAALQKAIRLSPEDGQAARLLLEQIRQLSPEESGS